MSNNVTEWAKQQACWSRVQALTIPWPRPFLDRLLNAAEQRENERDAVRGQQMLNGIEESRTRAASKFNVNSTPTFFINGKIFRGALTPEELDKQVAPYLKG